MYIYIYMFYTYTSRYDMYVCIYIYIYTHTSGRCRATNKAADEPNIIITVRFRGGSVQRKHPDLDLAFTA